VNTSSASDALTSSSDGVVDLPVFLYSKIFFRVLTVQLILSIASLLYSLVSSVTLTS